MSRYYEAAAKEAYNAYNSAKATHLLDQGIVHIWQRYEVLEEWEQLAWEDAAEAVLDD
jgi:hypothetical protein